MAGHFKKTILFLFPYKFTEFEYYKYEISKLEKKNNLNVIVNDLSEIINNRKFNEIWKTKAEKKTVKFSTLFSWIAYFNKIKKKNVIIFSHLQTSNLSSFIINLTIRLSKLPIIFYEEASPFSRPKKNINFFLSRIKQHAFNYKVYLYYLKQYFFGFLVNLISHEKVILFSNIIYKKSYNGLYAKRVKNFINLKINSYDFSNAMSFKISKKKKLKKYIIYLDDGGPYFTGDTHEKGNEIPNYNIKKWYKDLDIFLNKIEKYFNAKVIIIPHPKYKSPNSKKIKSYNPYFSNRKVNNDYDALAKLSHDCLFFIDRGSTAISYAIFHNRPIVQIYSSEHLYTRGEFQCILDQTKNTGTKPINILSVNRQKIVKSLKVNKMKYKNYKYNYLTPKNKKIEQIPNYKIIGEFINKNILIKQ